MEENREEKWNKRGKREKGDWRRKQGIKGE
jgi:hypothetical protein